MENEVEQFNVNDKATVTLTALGQEIWREHWHASLAAIGEPTGSLAINEDGQIRTELWQLAHIFGPHLYNGGKQLFVNNRIVIRRRCAATVPSTSANTNLQLLLKQLAERESWLGVEKCPLCQWGGTDTHRSDCPFVLAKQITLAAPSSSSLARRIAEKITSKMLAPLPTRVAEIAAIIEYELAATPTETGWWDIESAPKNATYVLLKLKDGSTLEGHWAQDYSGECQPPFDGWFDHNHVEILRREIEGWMPLPAPPGSSNMTNQQDWNRERG